MHIEPRRRYNSTDTTESGPEAAGARGRGRRLSNQTSASEEEDGVSVSSTEAVCNFEMGPRTNASYEDPRKGQRNDQSTTRTIWSVSEDDGAAEGTVEDTIDSTDATTRTIWSVSEDDGTTEGTVEDTIDSTDADYNFDAHLRNEALTIVVQPGFGSGVVRDLRAVLELIEIAITPIFEEQYNQDA